MLGPDFFSQELMNLMRSWVGIYRDVSCVVMSVKVLVMLWECPTYSSSRADSLLTSQEKLGNGFECFDSLDGLGKSSFIGSELWKDCFNSLLALLKDDFVNIWDTHKLMVMTHSSLSPQLVIWGALLGLRGTVA